LSSRSARISSVANGGQICVSQDVTDIIQQLVMKDQPVLLASDAGSDEDEDDDEVWLDPTEKRDVLALRRLGFGIVELGERRLKGIEAPELLSLIWPKSLKERNRVGVDEAEAEGVQVAEVHDPSTQIMDVALVKSIGRVCLRLESAASYIIHGHPVDDSLPISPANGGPIAVGSNAVVATIRPKVAINPSTLIYPIRPDATDDELAALLEIYLIRIENVISSLVLHNLGPYTETLAALASALKTDPRYVLNALSRFSALMR
jgi:adenylate cyclase